MSLTRIVVATDHSETAQLAEEFAGRLAGPGATLEVSLLYVHPELPVKVGRAGVADVTVDTEHLTPEERDEMRALLSKAAERIKSAAGTNPVAISEDLVGGS